eukprot:TRINITY_DN122129_c0_g1_i1.p2 TRINITY_DN122129_c0_g1~~TRINITY_DN122129_c0_g1_i1.p2  ORF type:complete len:152 (+),score=19.46 TRINITY_DN122129_c0_g1_i1:3-458(+)
MSDNCGNTAEAIVFVEVSDDVPPIFDPNLNNGIIFFDCFSDFAFIDFTATDACSSEVKIEDIRIIEDGAESGDAIAFQTVTVMDDCGNSDTRSFSYISTNDETQNIVGFTNVPAGAVNKGAPFSVSIGGTASDCDSLMIVAVDLVDLMKSS